jgi:hypothetical protein
MTYELSPDPSIWSFKTITPAGIGPTRASLFAFPTRWASRMNAVKNATERLGSRSIQTEQTDGLRF